MEHPAIKSLSLKEQEQPPTPLQIVENLHSRLSLFRHLAAKAPSDTVYFGTVFAQRQLMREFDAAIQNIVPSIFRNHRLDNIEHDNGRFHRIFYRDTEVGAAFQITKDHGSLKVYVSSKFSRGMRAFVVDKDQSGIELFNHIEKFFI